jgi:phosphoribosylformimino-5-aminoimidazole carboxamide ribonucleotide (ProFAR) isomerase
MGTKNREYLKKETAEKIQENITNYLHSVDLRNAEEGENVY